MEKQKQRICRQDGLTYEYQGEIEGYEIYVHYAEQGPDVKEAMALFEEARNDATFQMMLRAAIRLEKQADSGMSEKTEGTKRNEIPESRMAAPDLFEKTEESKIKRSAGE